MNRSTRELFAASYYAGTIFYIMKEDCCRWVSSLPKSFIATLAEIRILNLALEPSCNELTRHDVRADMMRGFEALKYAKNGTQQIPHFLKFKVGVQYKGAGSWKSLEDVLGT